MKRKQEDISCVSLRYVSAGSLVPFLKWAGGKRQLLNEIKSAIPDFSGTFIEPFVGGGSVFLALEKNKIIINDSNEQLINCYTQIKDNFESIIFELGKLNYKSPDLEYYRVVRERFNSHISQKISTPETAALMMYLNKNCYNGLYRVNSSGLFNVPFNKNIKETHRQYDFINLRNISDYLSGIEARILCNDFKNVCNLAKKGDFVFLDPPYVRISKTAYFESYTKDGFALQEQFNLARICRQFDKDGIGFLLSNNDDDFIREEYKGFYYKVVGVNRSINCTGKKRKSTEILITNTPINDWEML